MEAPTKGERSLSHDSSSLILLPLSDQTPYRDSAYFSDYESERQHRDDGEELLENADEEEPGKDEEELQSTGPNKDIKLVSICDVETSNKKDQWDQEELLEPSTAEGALDEWPSQEESSSLGDWAAEVVGAMEEALDALNGESNSTIRVEEEEEPEVQTSQSGPSGTSGDLLHPKDEVALQNIRRFSSSSHPPPSTSPPPLPAADPRGSPGDGEEADEENGDTDDSDESDEELRSYSVQEQSGGEESEDECHPVPIVVSDDSDAHKLRSLLRMPTLLTAENLEGELERKKRTVSFFDDVTVYLFDQESPTKELAEHGFSVGTEGQSSRNKPQDRATVSDDSSDGNISEESAGYEWEDDFPLLPLPTSSAAPDSPPPRSAPRASEPKAAAPFSRFTVSPSSVSRFSITHISDSDMDSVGGSSEDGDKE